MAVLSLSTDGRDSYCTPLLQHFLEKWKCAMSAETRSHRFPGFKAVWKECGKCRDDLLYIQGRSKQNLLCFCSSIKHNHFWKMGHDSTAAALGWKTPRVHPPSDPPTQCSIFQSLHRQAGPAHSLHHAQYVLAWITFFSQGTVALCSAKEYNPSAIALLSRRKSNIHMDWYVYCISLIFLCCNLSLGSVLTDSNVPCSRWIQSCSW